MISRNFKKICCSGEKKYNKFRIVLNTSIIILGLIICIFGGVVYNQNFWKDIEELSYVREYFLKVTLPIGLISMMFGFCGLYVSVFKRDILKLCYGCCMCVLSIIFPLVAVFFFIYGTRTLDKLDDFCVLSYPSDDERESFFPELTSNLKKAEKINKLSSEYMCTTKCPCRSDYMDLNKWSEAQLNKQGRTKEKKNQDKYTLLLLSESQDSFTRFWDCYTKNLKDQESLSQTQREFLQTTESSFSCNGICKQGIFYIYKDLKEGPPSDTCYASLEKTFKEPTYNIAISIFVLVFLTKTACVFICCYRKVKVIQQDNKPKVEAYSTPAAINPDSQDQNIQGNIVASGPIDPSFIVGQTDLQAQTYFYGISNISSSPKFQQNSQLQEEHDKLNQQLNE